MGRKAKIIHTLLINKVSDDKCIAYKLEKVPDYSTNSNNPTEYIFKAFKEFYFSDYTTQFILSKLKMFLDGDIQFSLMLDDHNTIYKSKRGVEYTLLKSDKWVCECMGYSTGEKCHHTKEMYIWERQHK